MSRCAALALIASAGVLCQCRIGAADEARFPAHRVDVQMTIAADGRATVDEEYALTAGITDPVFEFLGNACGEVGPVSATADDRPTGAPNIVARGPWTFLRYEGSAGARTWRVHYEVTIHGTDAVVPVVMPAGSLETEPGARGARVDIALRWTGSHGAARVVMPRLIPHSPPDDLWQATLLAVPSAILVRVPATDACHPAEAGSTGGLEWRFSVFALTMVVWAAWYLAWFGRSWSARS